jgi:hypothetical protein
MDGIRAMQEQLPRSGSFADDAKTLRAIFFINLRAQKRSQFNHTRPSSDGNITGNVSSVTAGL